MISAGDSDGDNFPNLTEMKISKFCDKWDLYTSVKCHVEALRIYLLKLRDDQGKSHKHVKQKRQAMVFFFSFKKLKWIQFHNTQDKKQDLHKIFVSISKNYNKNFFFFFKIAKFSKGFVYFDHKSVFKKTKNTNKLDQVLAKCKSIIGALQSMY